MTNYKHWLSHVRYVSQQCIYRQSTRQEHSRDNHIIRLVYSNAQAGLILY